MDAPAAGPSLRPLLSAPDGPQVHLLDASGTRLGEAGLRAWARSWCEDQRAAHHSRSYRHPYALIAWHGMRVGVDLEQVEPFDRAFAESICTPQEQLPWASMPDRDARCASLWSSKEALAKTLGDALAYDPRRLPSPLLWPDGRAGALRALQLPVGDRHVAWVCFEE